MGSLENHRQLAKTRVGEIEDQFAKVGGRHWEQRESLLGRQGEWKESVRETENRLVGLAATDLPLALVPDLLAAVQRQAAAERDAAETEVVARLLAERDAELLALLREKRAGQRVIGLVSEFLEADRTRRGTLIPAGEDGQKGADRLRLSNGARQLLDHFLQSGRDERQTLARQQLDQLERARRSLEDVDRSLAATPDEATIGAVVQQLKTASAELAGYEAQVGRLEKELAQLRTERDEIAALLAKRRRKIVDEELRLEEEGQLARLLVRTQATMQDYLRRATQGKIDRRGEKPQRQAKCESKVFPSSFATKNDLGMRPDSRRRAREKIFAGDGVRPLTVQNYFGSIYAVVETANQETGHAASGASVPLG